MLYLVSKYGFSGIKLFPIIEFAKQPDPKLVFGCLWLFVAFNIFSFIQRYRFEKPLMPYSLITLDVTLGGLEKHIVNNESNLKKLFEEVGKYSKLSRSVPNVDFSQIKADEFSAKFFDLLRDFLPVLRNNSKDLELVTPELSGRHYAGGFNAFSRTKDQVCLLAEHMEIIYHLAIKLSSRNRTESLDDWPDVLTSASILQGALDNSKKYITDLKNELPKRKKLEHSLNFNLSFNIPLMISCGLFLASSGNFLSNNWLEILDFAK